MRPAVRRILAATGLAAAGLAGAAPSAPAQVSADSLTGNSSAPVSRVRPDRGPLLRPAEAAVAGGMILTAALFDGAVRREAMEDRSATSNSIARTGNQFGTLRLMGPVLLAGWAAGELLDKPALSGAAAQALASGLVAGGVTAVLKTGIGRVRPNAAVTSTEFEPFSKNTSFPSGHTALAVAIATSLAHSTPDSWSDIGFYGAAGLTGFARINDNKHWFSDVVGGAVIGFLAGRRFHYRPGSRIQPVIGPTMAGVSISLGGIRRLPAGVDRADGVAGRQDPR